MTDPATPPIPAATAVPWRVGDLVEVRSLAEIAATLDDRGDLAGLPFMPEMAAFCGRRFRVVKTAHKTCDASGWVYARAMPDALHLDTRCDGAAHDGCEAACRLFWKTAWLKRVDAAATPAFDADPDPVPAALAARLAAGTRAGNDGDEPLHRCQATEIKHATTRLKPWSFRQYGQDVAGGNIAPTTLVRTFAASVPRVVRSKFGKLRRKIQTRLLRVERRRSVEMPTLDLKPGELVRIRPAAEIRATLNEEGKNFGLSFDADMVGYCGTTRRVAARIHRIVDEANGRMIRFRRAVIALDDVLCTGLCYPTRLFCPRGMYTFWREGWLERVAEPAAAPSLEAADTAGRPG